MAAMFRSPRQEPFAAVEAAKPYGNRHRRRDSAAQGLHIGLINVAPTPIFAGLKRLNQGMAGGVEMFRRVAVLGGVTAAHMPAGQAQAQLDPLVARGQALLAAFPAR